MNSPEIPIGIVDDHQLFSSSLSMLLSAVPRFKVVLTAKNGREMITKLQKKDQQIPAIMLVDVSMPIMNGPDTCAWIRQHKPEIKVAALSMNAEDKSIIAMVRSGCCAYLLKEIHPDELELAIVQIFEKGFYYSATMQIKPPQFMTEDQQIFTAREIQFIKLAASDFTYVDIAEKLGLAESTIDGYRARIFDKLGVSSRVGMVIECLRQGYIDIHEIRISE